MTQERCANQEVSAGRVDRVPPAGTRADTGNQRVTLSGSGVQCDRGSPGVAQGEGFVFDFDSVTFIST